MEAVTENSYQLFDSHFHLYPEDDLATVVDTAHQARVAWLTAVAVDLAGAERLAEQVAALGDQQVLTTVGVHPHEADNCRKPDLPLLRRLAARPMVKAIGEIGLDYHYDFSEPQAQQLLFRQLLETAGGLGLPVVVHCREAYEDCCRILRETKVAETSSILMHSYTGNAEWVRRFSQEFDACFSFNGIVTFKRADNVRVALAAVPEHRLLLETDAPYLAPVPFRGKRNQPAWLPRIAECVAGLRGCPMEQLARQTTNNARRFFGV